MKLLRSPDGSNRENGKIRMREKKFSNKPLKLFLLKLNLAVFKKLLWKFPFLTSGQAQVLPHSDEARSIYFGKTINVSIM